jgi:pimeloyl-ACP methyl ester carboxylesterase
LEAAYWLTPLPIDGLLSLVCSWPEIGLPETRTDIILPDLAVRAAEAVPLWDATEDSEA